MIRYILGFFTVSVVVLLDFVSIAVDVESTTVGCNWIADTRMLDLEGAILPTRGTTNSTGDRRACHCTHRRLVVKTLVCPPTISMCHLSRRSNRSYPIRNHPSKSLFFRDSFFGYSDAKRIYVCVCMHVCVSVCVCVCRKRGPYDNRDYWNPSTTSMTTGKTESKKSPAKRQPRTIQVYTCPSEFPGASDHRQQPRVPWEKRERTKKETVLRWHETAHEIHALGAQGFQGKQKKQHEADEYERLTGMKKKQQKVPLPIVRGIKKMAARRQDRLIEEARAAGLVLPNTGKRNKRNKKERDRTSDIHGPAPSIGFVNKGVFKYKDRKVER